MALRRISMGYCIPYLGKSGVILLRQPIHTRNTEISKHFKLREVSCEKDNRPLVLLFDWLYAKPSAVNKYCDLYHHCGLDVLTVSGRVSQFLWPPNAVKLSEELMSYLLFERKPQKYLVHAFSVGAYNYDVALYHAFENSDKYGKFRSRIQGQIFDSVTIGSYEVMCRGLATNLPQNRIIQKSILTILDTYYNLTSEHTKDQYNKLVDFFKDKPIKVPTLLFYAKNDPMCDVVSMEMMICKWQKMDNFDITFKGWDDSIHCAHLKCHPQDYRKKWTEFMQKVNIASSTV
ncbi:uncharacterized protein LOC126818236 [Patella vulgata]|uniref:uncharacterized protein LOC126818236 n=1 Tax=Patella vulgata TaxID=6465 RepID=UPI00218068CB|nr:uncharacterized protein LOC126818236 [Patella vulgata]